MKNRNITVVPYDEDKDKGVPGGKNIFYLCLKCRGIIPSYPEDSMSCTCGNVYVDIGGARGGADDTSQFMILKID